MNLEQLLAVKKEDINLKFIFDHIRNYGLAAGVTHAGVYISIIDGSGFNLILNCFLFISLFLIGFFLFILNLSHSIISFLALGIGNLAYYISGLFAVIVAVSFYVIQISLIAR